MDVDYRQVRLELDSEDIHPKQQQMPDLSKFEAASKFLPTGEEIYKVVKYLDLSANIEIVLVYHFIILAIL
jgi:hypothetical protein